MAKALYSNLFDWVVSSVNHAMEKAQISDSTLEIGVLDIFGFEV